mmetsp:Transcript_135645/g.270663  ORF Transcript_135645/g.270663 Transcript_135645/m.270663 type:complete len:204 (-) Transcript_135645:823-1434(-)
MQINHHVCIFVPTQPCLGLRGGALHGAPYVFDAKFAPNGSLYYAGRKSKKQKDLDASKHNSRSQQQQQQHQQHASLKLCSCVTACTSYDTLQCRTVCCEQWLPSGQLMRLFAPCITFVNFLWLLKLKRVVAEYFHNVFHWWLQLCLCHCPGCGRSSCASMHTAAQFTQPHDAVGISDAPLPSNHHCKKFAVAAASVRSNRYYI